MQGLNNFRGTTDNYLRVLFNQEGAKPMAGSYVKCRILSYNDNMDIPDDERIDAVAVVCGQEVV